MGFILVDTFNGEKGSLSEVSSGTFWSKFKLLTSDRGPRTAVASFLYTRENEVAG